MNKFLNRLSTLLLMLMAVIPMVHLVMYSFSLSADQRLPVFLIVAVLFCWLMFSFWRFSLPGILVCLALAILFYQGRSEILSAQFEDIANRMAVAYYNRFVSSGYVYSGTELSHTEAMLFVGFVLSALMGLTLNSQEDRIFLPLLISLPIVFLCLLVYGQMPGWVMLCLSAFVFLLLSTGRINSPEGNTGKSFLLLFLPVALLLSSILLFKNPGNYNYEEQKLSLVDLAQGITKEFTASLREDAGSSSVNVRLPQPSEGDDSFALGNDLLNVSGSTLDISNTPELSSLKQVILYATSSQSGHFYLRSRSYGSYTGAGWGQAPDYPGEHVPAFSAQAIAASQSSVQGEMDISLASADPSLMYLPYYCTQDYDSESGISGGESSYSLTFFSYASDYASLSLPAELRDMELSYRQFVYANYLSLPDSTRASLQELASQNSLSGDGVYETIALVAEYVRSRCPYNINTQPYPSEDYALYFFTQATEGYCIHFATAATAMYRALAPLEAIIQAAGRCNRNGRAKDGGQLKVFIPEDERRIYPGDSYQKGAEIVKIMWAAGCLDIHDPDVIADYYCRLFHGAKDREALTRAIFSEDYEAVRQEYRLIRRQGVQVIVPYDLELFHRISLQAQRDGLTPALIKQAAPITVSTCEEPSVRRHCESVLWHRGRQDGNVESDFFLLLAGHEGCYQSDMGLRLDSFNTDGEPFIF